MRPFLPAVLLLATVVLAPVASAEPGPVVEVKDCASGQEGVYLLGDEVVCFGRNVFDIRDCPSPTGQGYAIWVLGQEILCIP